MNPINLGFVVIGRNEGDRLIRCLQSLSAGAGIVVYVDSASTDGSVEAAERLGATVVRLDMSRPFTAARARNEGYAALKAIVPTVEFIQFIDGDCELVPGWLEAACRFLREREDVAVVCGRRRERHPEASIYNRMCDLEWDTPVGEAAACGGDSLVRATAFEAVGGYLGELIAGEEPELCLRLREGGWRVWRLDTEMTFHDAAIYRFSQWWLRTVRGGFGFAEVSRLHANSPLRIYDTEVRRAAIWAGAIPLAIILCAAVDRSAAVAGLVYPLQVIRIALRRKGSAPLAWTYAAFVTIAKFAELQGILKFHFQRLTGLRAVPLDYKKSCTS